MFVFPNYTMIGGWRPPSQLGLLIRIFEFLQMSLFKVSSWLQTSTHAQQQLLAACEEIDLVAEIEVRWVLDCYTCSFLFITMTLSWHPPELFLLIRHLVTSDSHLQSKGQAALDADQQPTTLNVHWLLDCKTVTELARL